MSTVCRRASADFPALIRERATALGYPARMANAEPDPQDETHQDETPQDETKRKFLEALERKKSKSAVAADRKDAVGKQSRGHGPVENRREFRRRSGG
jgi:hypothetical protein